tara:strand:- start:14200 stop:14424 length:225 start_codon:yes stop_codon:yes gene_type:complete
MMYPPPRKKGKRAKWYLFSCPHIYIPCTQCRVIYPRKEKLHWEAVGKKKVELCSVECFKDFTKERKNDRSTTTS